MAIIYSYQGKTNLASNDVFVINDSDDGNKTKNATLGDITTYIDNNLSYDLQQVLNAGPNADLATGTWTTIDVWKDQGATEPFLKIEPANEHLYVYGEIFMRNGVTKTANIKTDGHQDLKITSDNILYTQSMLHVSTAMQKHLFQSRGDSSNVAWEFDAATLGATTYPYMWLKQDINLWLDCKVTDSAGVLGSADKVLKSDANGYLEWADLGSPGGAATNVQYQGASGEFAGEEAFKWTTGTNTLEIGVPTLERGIVRIHSQDSVSQGTLAMHDGNGDAINIIVPSVLTSGSYDVVLPEDGPSSQVNYLVSDASGVTSWADYTQAGSVTEIVLNSTASPLDFGTPVYINSNTTGVAEIGPAKAGGKMPAVGLVMQEPNMAAGAQGKIMTLGLLESVDSGMFVGTAPSVGAIVFVADTTGKLTIDRPIGSSSDIQVVGVISRDASSGQINIQVDIGNSFRLPNGSTSQLWTVDGSGYPVQTGTTLTVEPDPTSSGLGIVTMQDKLAAEVEFQVGTDNLAIGKAALINYATPGTGANVAYGKESLNSCTDGINNTAIGYFAGNSIDGTTKSDNVFLGWNAGSSGADQTQNTIIGSQALRNAGGVMSDNVVIGWSAASSATALFTTNNVVIGSDAGFQAAGQDNVIVGKSAGRLVSDGNVIVGNLAGQLYAGDENTYIGALAGQNATGGEVVCVGGRAGSNMTTGTRSVYIGYMSAGTTQQSGSNNVLIGTTVDTELNTTSDAVAIGDSASVGTSSVGIGNAVDATGDGNVAIGNNADTNGLELVVAIGQAATSNGSLSTILGSGSNGVAQTTVVGSNATASVANGVAIGHQADSAGGLAINISGGAMSVAPSAGNISLETGSAVSAAPGGGIVAGQKIIINGTVYTIALY